MDNFGTNMILVAQSEDEPKKEKSDRGSKKKGDGINAILTLLKELRDFQDRVAECSESQEITDNKAKVDQFNDYLDSMAETLLDIAKGAIVRGREKEGGEEVLAPPADAKTSPAPAPKTSVTAPSAPSGPIMSSVIHQLPK